MSFGVVDVEMLFLLTVQNPVADDDPQAAGSGENRLARHSLANSCSGTLQLLKKFPAVF